MRLPVTELKPGDIVHEYGTNYTVIKVQCPGLTADPDRVYLVSGNHTYSIPLAGEVAVIQRWDGSHD